MCEMLCAKMLKDAIATDSCAFDFSVSFPLYPYKGIIFLVPDISPAIINVERSTI